MDNELPEGWMTVPSSAGLVGTAFAIYRDAAAGRQIITLNHGRFELSQQGWEGTLAISPDLQEALDTADRYQTFRCFRIANMSQDELSEFVMQSTWMAVACLSDPTQANVGKARKAISDVETIMAALRVRCAQKDPAGLDDIHVKADQYAAELRYVTMAIYKRLSDGEVTDAVDDLGTLEQLIGGIEDDVADVRAKMLQGGDNGSN